tara:strand:+ start:52854 stop:53288 length:435 start_codon:yes stop_codon:yes gene_type:complete
MAIERTGSKVQTMHETTSDAASRKLAAGMTAMTAVAALLWAFAGPAFAEEATTAPEIPAGHSYEIHDDADSPPVNYRSDQDEKYDTPEQHDAEMFAEEYERQREEKALKDKKMLDEMNTLTSPGGTLNGDLGAKDAGFPPRAPY